MSSQSEGPKVADKDSAGPARRNRYFSGKLLTVADYVLEQRYHIERRWLINRMLHGWGVVSGLEVGAVPDGGWRVSPGMALDRHGRELVVCGALDLEEEGDLIWLGGEAPIAPSEARPGPGSASYLLCAHYAERGVDGVRLEDDYGDGACEANRVCETVVFSLARDPGPAGDPVGQADPCRAGKLTRLGRLQVDLELAVPLARVTVTFPESGPPTLGPVDQGYSPRPLGRPSTGPPPGDAEQTGPRTGGPLRHEPRVAVATRAGSESDLRAPIDSGEASAEPAPEPPPPPPPAEGDPT